MNYKRTLQTRSGVGETVDKLIIEFSKYVLITLMVIYTLQSILIFAKRSEEAREFLFIRQNVVMFCLHFVAFMVLYLQMNQSQILFFTGNRHCIWQRH